MISPGIGFDPGGVGFICTRGLYSLDNVTLAPPISRRVKHSRHRSGEDVDVEALTFLVEDTV